MKKLVSLVLVLAVVFAMVCAFAVNASAEEESAEETSAEEEAKVVEPDEYGDINIIDAGNYILKNGQYSVGNFAANSPDYVLTVPKDAVVTVERNFGNFGTLYVYGTLIVNATDAYNGGTIYVYGTLIVNAEDAANFGAIRVYCDGKFEGTIAVGREVVQSGHDFDAYGFCKNCGKPDGTILSGKVWYQLTENDTKLPNGSSGLTLVIGGEGDMPSFLFFEDRPWHNVAGSITAVEIKSGVKSIATNAFYGCTDLKEVTIPNTVTSIGENAFDERNFAFVIHGTSGTAAEQYAKENGVDFFVDGECKHVGRLVCETCQAHLTGSELLQAWEGDDLSGSTISGGNLAIIVGIAALVIGLGGGFLLGRKKRKPAVAGGNSEKTSLT